MKRQKEAWGQNLVAYNDSRIEAFSFDNGTDATNPTLYVDASMTGAS